MGALLLTILLLFGGAARVSAAPAEGDLFAEAESRYLGHNYTAALEEYDAFLKAYPLSERVSDVQYRRAASLYHLGRYADSLALLQDIEQHYRSTRYLAFVPLWEGLSQYQLGSYSLSVQSLDLFLAGPADPDFTPQALLYRALDQISLSNEPEAITSLQTVTSTYPKSATYPYSVVLLGSLYQKAGSMDKLLALTEGIESASIPQRWRDDFLLLRAEGLSGSGRDSEALPVYRGLTSAQDDSIAVAAYGWLFTIAQRSQDLQQMQDLTNAAENRFTGRTALLAGLWTRVGAESFDRGAFDAAESFLRRAWNVRKSVPVSEVVPLYLAEILLSRKDSVGARSLLEEYVAAGSVGSGAAIIRLGDIALLTDDFATAARWYTQFRQSFPQSARAPEAGYMLAYCEYRQGDTAGSLRLAQELEGLSLDPSLAQQVSRLKIVLLKAAGRTSEAADALALYVGRYPSDLGSQIDYLKVLFVLKRTDELLVEADAVRRQFPSLQQDNPADALLVSYLRGLALIAAKSYGAAVTELSTITAAAADKAGLSVIVPYAGYYLGWGYLRGGDYAKAAGVFDQLAAAYPTHELASQVLYLSGWAHFSAGDYDKAASVFSQLASKPGQGDLGSKAQYLYAKSLMNLQRRDEAAATPAEAGVCRAAHALVRRRPVRLRLRALGPGQGEPVRGRVSAAYPQLSDQPPERGGPVSPGRDLRHPRAVEGRAGRVRRIPNPVPQGQAHRCGALLGRSVRRRAGSGHGRCPSLGAAHRRVQGQPVPGRGAAEGRRGLRGCPRLRQGAGSLHPVHQPIPGRCARLSRGHPRGAASVPRPGR